jgi:hypothetical protein
MFARYHELCFICFGAADMDIQIFPVKFAPYFSISTVGGFSFVDLFSSYSDQSMEGRSRSLFFVFHSIWWLSKRAEYPENLGKHQLQEAVRVKLSSHSLLLRSKILLEGKSSNPLLVTSFEGQRSTGEGNIMASVKAAFGNFRVSHKMQLSYIAPATVQQ